MQHFFDIAFTESVLEHQRRQGSFEQYGAAAGRFPAPTRLGPDERAFLTERDSFYLASVDEHGWPYVQHRGGPVGFVTVLDDTHIAWAERKGNRQFLTAGHLDADDRVALIAVDYPTRQRLKLYGHARYDADPSPELAARVPLGDARIDGIVVVDVVATDWNCPKHITPRYTADQIRSVTTPLTDRIAELERELAELRGGQLSSDR